ncbi:hypothetical protein NDR77_07220 [Pseudomonas aeruginosa]|nr:hypothetical protein [Pseudomonas aeruginosa]MDG3945114.1 hypothetical protein [Pseudomonas aeruginosa]HBN7639168.1 hypothetical protein [Pseudomonas aeruginosa]HBN7779494.1 hypothetical protein [Pseudomonas aeruginosa]HBN7800816.1 hypothetical protein [Pseudomonas aeruginosa]
MSDLNELAQRVAALDAAAKELAASLGDPVTNLQSLSDTELAQRIIDTLDDRDAAALAAACLMAQAHGKDRPDVKTARTCCTLAGANAQRVMPFLGYLPLKGYADAWADAEKGAHGPGIVDRTQEPGLFVFRQLGGRLRANLRFIQASEEI